MKIDLDKGLLDQADKRDETTVAGGWRIVPLKDPAKFKHYLDHMVALQQERDKNREKFKVSTIQSPSAQRVLDMNEDELKEYQARKIDYDKAQVWKSKEEAEAALTKAEARKESPDAILAQGLREREKNTMGDAKEEILAGTIHSPKAKENAVNAFMDTEAKLLPIQKAMVQTADPECFKHKDAKPQEPRPLWKRILSGKWVNEEFESDRIHDYKGKK